MALSPSMDKLGPMARTAHDCRTLLCVLSGPDTGDASSALPPPLHLGRGLKKPGEIRVGVLHEDWEKHSEPEVERAFNEAITALRKLGMKLRDAALPDGHAWATRAAGVIISCEGAACFADLLRSGRFRELADDEQQIGLLAGLAMPAADYLRAMQARGVYGEMMARLFQDFEVLVAPAMPRVAPPVEENFGGYFRGGNALSGVANVCGLPGVCVPIGRGAHGLPVGLQFAAAAGNEAAVLKAAKHFQRATDWHRQRPQS